MAGGIEALDINKLTADLRGVQRDALPIMRKAIQKTSADIKATAQIFCPVDTGNLRSSISYETHELVSAVWAEIGPTADYGAYVEFGTTRMAPYAYLGPAFDRHGYQLDAALAQIADGLR